MDLAVLEKLREENVIGVLTSYGGRIEKEQKIQIRFL